MKILIPTAKEMVKPTANTPILPLSNKTKAIISSMAQQSPDQLATLYKIKPNMAEMEWQRWQELYAEEASNLPAIQLFNGLMYRQIKRENLTLADQTYLSNHLFITSALYGVIPADQPIAQHRLDFHTNIKVQDQSLKNLWQADYDQFINQACEPIISLLSSEFEQVFSRPYQDQLIKLAFLEEDTDGQLKKHSTISKKARGHFVNALVQAKPSDINDLKSLVADGFHYRDDLSSGQTLTYVKQV